MIVALPSARNPKKLETEMIERHGLMTFPQFLDNHFIGKGEANIKYLEKNLRKYGNGLVRFAVAPDYKYEEMERLRKEWDVEWIFPLHSRKEDFSKFEWIGFPRREKTRDYDLKTFLRLTQNKKRWYLGFVNESHPEHLLLFNGLDTTIPFYYAQKYGKLWYGWKRNEQAAPFLLHRDEILEFNVISFKYALLKLYKSQNQSFKTFGDA